ncbi:PASTA domain-containing protein [Actinomycetospora sp. CA-101289]|uniref:PASTA domain-containing protein n=1 Tax=Actinomycetospora sp. CA-101289 TaxID=3239893 RepID=UPI003D970FF3
MIDVSPAPSAEPVRTVRVPELVGVPAMDAHDRALDAGLLAVAENATHTAGGRSLIHRQDPDPGAEVEHGAIVRIWVSA